MVFLKGPNNSNFGQVLNLDLFILRLEEAIELPFSYFTNPGKRLFYWYLLSSIGLALFVFLRTKIKSSFLKYILHPKVWFSKSARVDYYFFFFNGFVKVLFIGPYLLSWFYVETSVNDYCYRFFGESSFIENSTSLIIWYTLVLFVVKDFGSFFIHYLFHKIPFLWRFHQVHHSATVLNPVTQFRIHPVELILNNVQGFVLSGMVTGVFNYLAGGSLTIWQVVGVNGFNFLFLLFGSNLRHSHVKLKFPAWLEFVLISPFQHQIHHGRDKKFHDKNMGSTFAFWDWMFGTLRRSITTNKLKFGIDSKAQEHYSSFLQNLLEPFNFKRK